MGLLCVSNGASWWLWCLAALKDKPLVSECSHWLFEYPKANPCLSWTQNLNSFWRSGRPRAGVVVSLSFKVSFPAQAKYSESAPFKAWYNGFAISLKFGIQSNKSQASRGNFRVVRGFLECPSYRQSAFGWLTSSGSLLVTGTLSKSLSLADLSFFYKKDFVAAPGQVIKHCDSVRQAVL